MKNMYVYIVMSKKNTALYIGVTNDLKRRIYEHKTRIADSHTKKYNIDKLVYFEVFQDTLNAITREKELKGWLRRKKIQLIESKNPEYEDLYESIIL